MAEHYGLSFRTLRYYEERGLLNPIRRGFARIYTSEDHVRIKIILTGKRLGFSLSQIHELIDPRSLQPSPEARDMEDAKEESTILEFLTADETQQQLQLLERQRDDLDDALSDLRKSLDEKPETRQDLETRS